MSQRMLGWSLMKSKSASGRASLTRAHERVSWPSSRSGQNEQAWTALRHPMDGIEDDRVNRVAKLVESQQRLLEVAPAVAHQKSDDVLQHDKRRPTIAHVADDLHEAPERRRLFSVQPLPTARDGKVVAWERCREQGATRHFIRLECVNVADDKMVVVRPVVPVHFGLFGINVVCKNDTPALVFQGKPH